MWNPRQLFRQFCCLAAVALAVIAVEAAPPPGCHQCGGVDVPFPFGIGAGCHLEGFDVQCNTSFNPPRPFIGGTDVELIDISLPSGEARVYKRIDWICYNRSIYVDYWLEPIDLSARSAYRVSGARNRFTALGCATAAYITSDGQDGYYSYVSGCVEYCRTIAETQNGTCAGRGCCQTAIPAALTNIGTNFGTGWINNSMTFDFNPCSYAFVAEESWYFH